MDNLVYADFDYDPTGDDVEYADYYDEVYDMPSDDSWDQEDEILPKFSLGELLEYCVTPTLSDSTRHLYNLLIWSLIFTLTTKIVRLPTWCCHISSAVCGGVVLWQMFARKVIYLAGLAGACFLALSLTHLLLQKHRGVVTTATAILFLILCELFFVEPADWHSIRGAQMIILMKVVSIGFDLDVITNPTHPNIIEFIGYLLNPGTVVFGPWVSLPAYRASLRTFNWDIWWILGVMSKLVYSIVCLLLSTCFVNWVIPEVSNTGIITRYQLAYQEAASFRMSHYFVSYLSEASALLAGIKVNSVSEPYKIEMPRSLVQVVVYWNIPMHYWLKTYIFKTAKIKLGVVSAIFFTYFMSALFHGLNFQLAAVLFSLGLYTYIEYTLRTKLAYFFNACILARPCPEAGCTHTFTGHTWFTTFVNFVFMMMSMFHLAYLGVMFDSSPQLQETGYSMRHTLNKWANLHFASHWLMFLCYVLLSVM